MTTAELGKIFIEKGINVKELPESDFDCLVGEGTGGAVLFGTTGGVMEAALRTVYEQVRSSEGAQLCWHQLAGEMAATSDYELLLSCSHLHAAQPVHNLGIARGFVHASESSTHEKTELHGLCFLY